MQAIYFGMSYLAFADGLSAGGVALIVSLQPILVAIFAPLFVSEIVSRFRWLGLLLGLAGAALVIGSRQEISTASWAGVVFAVTALIAMSAGSIYEKRFGVKQHPVVATIVQFTVGFLVIWPIALVREGFRHRVYASVVRLAGLPRHRQFDHRGVATAVSDTRRRGQPCLGVALPGAAGSLADCLGHPGRRDAATGVGRHGSCWCRCADGKQVCRQETESRVRISR
jgi:threonine/homoserine efflux transporter RhtA